MILYVNRNRIGIPFKRGGGAAAPDPDALFDTRTDLTISDSVGGLSLGIERFPQIRLDRLVTGNNIRWESNYIHNTGGDFTFLQSVKEYPVVQIVLIDFTH